MLDNLLIISRDVVYTNLENILKADVIEYDIKQKIQKFICMIKNKKLI